MAIQQTSCKQCGICCTKGGPALHSDDLDLFKKGLIPYSDLITIRKGEFAYNPVTKKLQATQKEIVKLKGSGGEWTCCYYDPQSRGCKIYEYRPMACGVLQCWNPEASLALVEKDLLSSLQIVAVDQSLMELISEYELECPLPNFENFASDLLEDPKILISGLENLMNCDIDFRNGAIARLPAVLQDEMFLFGRPLFQMLQSFGLLVSQKGNRLYLKIKKQ